VALNKWDAVEQKDDKTYLKSVEYVKDSLTAVKWAPVLLVSALTGQRCPKLYDAIDAAVAAHRTRVYTATLNDVVRRIGFSCSWPRDVPSVHFKYKKYFGLVLARNCAATTGALLTLLALRVFTS
jgi:predicted GTPase